MKTNKSDLFQSDHLSGPNALSRVKQTVSERTLLPMPSSQIFTYRSSKSYEDAKRIGIGVCIIVPQKCTAGSFFHLLQDYGLK